MGFQTVCSFSDVSERDMDMLFAEEFACSAEFLRMFTDRINIYAEKVLSVYLSKTDAALGESDITVVLESEGERIALLVEDKIDAIAMPAQADRYSFRGEKGIRDGEYDHFYVFIIAPEKYLSQNQEAQKYPNRIPYERIIEYFEELGGPRAEFKIQQIQQAIDKQKTGYQVEVNPYVTVFWQKYSEFQKKNYPELYLYYSGEEKGSRARWPQFGTVYEGLYILHKSQSGFVDLTFENCADRITEIEALLTNTVGDFLAAGYTVHRTGKSAALRLIVPILDFHEAFEDQTPEIDTCFAAIRKMTELVKKLPAGKVYDLID